jgi:hypothetical protein
MESSTIEQTPDMEQKFLNAIAGNAHYAAAVRECVKVHESALQPLLDELERVKGEREWISVQDRLPGKRRVRVLVWDGLTVTDAYFDTDDKWKYTDANTPWIYTEGITHWMHLPAPPGTPPSSLEPESQDLGKLTEAMQKVLFDFDIWGEDSQEAAAACAQVAMNFYKPSKP